MINGPENPELSIPAATEAAPTAALHSPDPHGVFLKLAETAFERQFYPSTEVFQRSAQPHRAPATVEHPPAPCLGFAGLAAAADQWAGVLRRYHEKSGAPFQAHCLKGHEIGWTGLINTTAQDWKRDVREKALAIRDETGQLPVLLGHSTGALAVIAAVAEYARENPGKQLCAGLVISSPAFELQSARYAVALVGAKFLHWLLPRSGVWKTAGATIDSALPSKPIREVNPNVKARGLEVPAKGLLNLVALGHKLFFPKSSKNSSEALSPEADAPLEIPSDYEPEQKDDAPAIRWVPILTYLQLQEIQWEARKAVSEITVPTLALISRTDYITKPDASLKYFRKIPSADKNSLVIDGFHSLMRDRGYLIRDFGCTPAHAFSVALESWLTDRRQIFDHANTVQSGIDSLDLSAVTIPPPAPPMNLLRLKEIIKKKGDAPA